MRYMQAYRLLAAALALTAAPAAATLYVYEAPDGSRVITDRMLGADHVLIHRSDTPANVGAVAARRGPARPRALQSRFDSLIHRLARHHRVEPALVKAVIHVESGFNPLARSHKGAAGLMQLMPETARRYGVTDVYDPRENLNAGIRHLRHLLHTFNHNKRLALAAYNAGEQSVQRYRGVPPYRETRYYVQKVLVLNNRYTTKYR